MSQLKYEHQPIRQVFIKGDLCNICNKEKKQILEITLQDFDGSYNRYGWRYCVDCKNTVKLVESQYYSTINHLSYPQCQNLIDRKLDFWRVPSNKNDKPYLQKNAFIRHHIDNTISYIKERTWIPVEWKENNQYLGKKITLANAIYFNQNIFGKKLRQFPVKNISTKWKKRIIKEYRIYQKMKFTLHQLNITLPKDITNCIFTFINDFNI